MSFASLYEQVQKREPKISSGWVRELVIEFSDITHVREQWSGLVDPTSVRGFWIEGPLGPPVPLKEKQGLVVLARDLPKPNWRRFVYVKELMHAFDTPEEKADTAEKFDAQAEKFGDPTAPPSPQFRAEAKAYWRALAALCPEKNRLKYIEQLAASEVSIDVIAVVLGIPLPHVKDLFRDEFPKIVQAIMQ